MSHTIHMLDVFAEHRYEGNQLAVVLEAQDLSTELMQAIARETNFSETTFVTSARGQNGGFDVRIFTPTEELPFAGHPTLGTAWLIRHVLHDEPPARINLNLGVGQVPVDFQGPSREDLGFLLAPGATFDGPAIIAEDARHRVVEYWIEFEYTATQAVTRFRDKVHPDVMKQHKEGRYPDKKYIYTLYIGPNWERYRRAEFGSSAASLQSADRKISRNSSSPT